MIPKITVEYPRTNDDYVAEIAAENAAMQGKWGKFMGVGSEVDGPINDIAVDAIAKRINDRHDFADKLAANGWPNGMIDTVADRHYPVK